MFFIYETLQRLGEMLKQGCKKAFKVLFMISLVVALSPLALIFGGILMVFALICAGFVLVGFCFGIGALFWVVQWVTSSGSSRAFLPWI